MKNPPQVVYSGPVKNKRSEDTKGIDHHRLPVGEVVGRVGDLRIRGEYSAIPLFSWVSLRDKLNTPLVMLVLLLLGEKENETGEDGVPSIGPVATLQVELPIFPETEDPIVFLLGQLGWDGRIWPKDEGWPSDSTEEETVKSMLAGADLKATLVFPPKEGEGVVSMPVKVERTKGPFLMPSVPAIPEGMQVDENLKQKLKALCENPKVFHRPPTRSLIYT